MKEDNEWCNPDFLDTTGKNIEAGDVILLYNITSKKWSTKYVEKEWKGFKKDLNIKSNGNQNDIWKSIDTQIKDTKTQLRNL